jgi:alpha-tubulin suppressor-like RCC1 family protein
LNNTRNFVEKFVRVENKPFGDQNIKLLECGAECTAIVTDRNELWICGYNHGGMFGMGDRFLNMVFPVFTKVDFQCTGAITHLAIGSHLMLVTNDCEIWAAGNNEKGQLGIYNQWQGKTQLTRVPFNSKHKVKQIACGDMHTVVLTTDSSVWVCGSNEYCKIGLPSSIYRSPEFRQVPLDTIRCNVTQIACGFDHTILLTDASSVYVAGDNSSGQIGMGSYYSHSKEHSSNNDATTFTRVPYLNNVKKICFRSGTLSTVLLTVDNRMIVTGYNTNYQLGLNDKQHRYTFHEVPFPSSSNTILTVFHGCNITLVITEQCKMGISPHHPFQDVQILYRQ